MGVDLNSPYRIMAGIRYILGMAASEGHTCLPREELLKKAVSLLAVDPSLTENALISLAVSQALVMEETDHCIMVYLTGYYQAEAGTARMLMDLAADRSIRQFIDLEYKIRRFEEKIRSVAGRSAAGSCNSGYAAWGDSNYRGTGYRKNHCNQLYN